MMCHEYIRKEAMWWRLPVIVVEGPGNGYDAGEYIIYLTREVYYGSDWRSLMIGLHELAHAYQHDRQTGLWLAWRYCPWFRRWLLRGVEGEASRLAADWAWGTLPEKDIEVFQRENKTNYEDSPD